jgi:hypothetical protein
MKGGMAPLLEDLSSARPLYAKLGAVLCDRAPCYPHAPL